MSKIPVNGNTLSKTKSRKRVHDIFDLATWIQHEVVAIHPFCDGNGRIARLMTNMVLIRYGFPASRVEHEGQDKPAYIENLCQIDLYQNYEPLRTKIIQSVMDVIAKERKLRETKQRENGVKKRR